ncbi:MAG: hypothetical protein RLZ10_2462 [Bacteroidota bacterium]|jgi:SAM-dependent methyltransferase
MIFNYIRKQIHFLKLSKRYLSDPVFKAGVKLSEIEIKKTPSRTEIINYLLSYLNRETVYLEIGVRDPADNYNHIKANHKYSVDPGLEFQENPVDFRVTSDAFFEGLEQNLYLKNDIKFDVIFIDGLHLAPQVDRDIQNALKYIKPDGFIVMHDCNPPTEWHARENYAYGYTPAGFYWNGTTWKAFLKWRFNNSVKSCCINTDWGVGLLCTNHNIGDSISQQNPFFEYHELEADRQRLLNLIDFSVLKSLLEKK